MTPSTPTQRTPVEAYDLWIKALRSGEYKQGRAALRLKNKFCCLGVLCDLIAKDGGPQWTTCSTGFGTFMHQGNYLPKEVVAFMRLAREEDHLVDLNDSGASFSKIADHIETNILPKVFK